MQYNLFKKTILHKQRVLFYTELYNKRILRFIFVKFHLITATPFTVHYAHGFVYTELYEQSNCTTIYIKIFG